MSRIEARCRNASWGASSLGAGSSPREACSASRRNSTRTAISISARALARRSGQAFLAREWSFREALTWAAQAQLITRTNSHGGILFAAPTLLQSLSLSAKLHSQSSSAPRSVVMAGAGDPVATGQRHRAVERRCRGGRQESATSDPNALGPERPIEADANTLISLPLSRRSDRSLPLANCGANDPCEILARGHRLHRRDLLC